jgi:SAM-dependent methyltransferase
MASPKQLLKHFAARLVRPGVHGIDQKADELLRRLDALREALPGAGGYTDKHRAELAYWRWLIKTDEGRRSLWAPFDVAFGAWQRDRLLDLGEFLGLYGSDRARQADPGEAIDAWCQDRSVLEIGAGPYPAIAAAPRWKRAVAVDPIAKGYVEEGLVPAAASHITYIEAPGERIPLPAGFADLVIIENALDHVADPAAVLAEIRRLLGPGGLLWLLVDLSTYSDQMHPHPFDEARLRGLLRQAGFAPVKDRISDHKSHPNAYGEYRGLLRPAEVGGPVRPDVQVQVPAASRPQASLAGAP